ncbi:endomucin [Cricetulus griseus]
MPSHILFVIKYLTTVEFVLGILFLQLKLETSLLHMSIPSPTSPYLSYLLLPSEVTTQPPDALPKTIVSPSASPTTEKTIIKLQVITLPVVIALIVITLLVFTLVGLYRMCWKRDPESIIIIIIIIINSLSS